MADPLLFNRASADRTQAAVKFVERQFRDVRRRGKGNRGWSAPGAWAYIGGAVSASVGTTLGTGSAVLCSRVGAVLTADGDTVTFYSAGDAFSGPCYVKLGWTDGDWSLDVAPC